MFLHWKRNRTMNNTKLKKAMILGTIALIWTIPSVNLFGVIAVIVSWIAYSNSKKNMAYVSTGMYIAATVISILFAIVLLFAGGMFSGRGCGRFTQRNDKFAQRHGGIFSCRRRTVHCGCRFKLQGRKSS